MKKWAWAVGVILLLLGAIVVLGSSRSQSVLAVVPDKMVTFTFDDGPDPRFTPQILDLLKKHDIKATFFVIGKNGAAHPDLLKEIAANGHLVANHTQNHPHLEELSQDEVLKEITEADQVLQSILGPAYSRNQYFRPPRGKISSAIEDATDELDKQIVLWNVCVENKETRTPEEVRARVMKLIHDRNGGILLAHDGELDRTLTVQSLPLLIEDLKREGFRIVPLDEYLKAQKNQMNSSIN